MKNVQFSVLPMETRFPFQYGIASMTELPHWLVFSEVEVDGKLVTGLASEGLPPKWFTKNPETTFEQDLPEFEAVIYHAVEQACAASEAQSFFGWWQALYNAQANWAEAQGIPGLLANLGVSLMERAVLDAVCRGTGESVHTVFMQNRLGIDLGAVHVELAGMQPADVIVAEPAYKLQVRHTMGLGDPLMRSDEFIDDGLPLSLQAIVAETGCRYFKIKVCGDLAVDIPRLEALAGLLPADAQFTVDGNEQYRDMVSFVGQYLAWRENEAIRGMLDRGLLFLEQPLHRDVALDCEIPADVGLPPVIIDEADADLASLPKALALGYAGTSHKHCKGIIKGLVNAALVKKHGGVLSGEDLANVGPIALLQDCTMMALFGIEHVERNGHHYFKGLSMWPEAVQARCLELHGDLYQAHAGGFPVLAISDGAIEIGSLLEAPFGLGLDPMGDFGAMERV